MQAQQVLQQVICFSLEDISLWGARKKLHSEDLKLTSSDTLPPKDLASLGSKKIFNPKALSKFEALKKRAHVACGRVGVRFMGGYAVPEAVADDLGKELDSIGAEFALAKSEFIANYQSELDKWIAEHPGWDSWIRAATIPVAEVQDRINYGWTPAKVSAPDEKPNSVLNSKMTKEAGGLAGRLFREIGEMAIKVRDESLLGKTKVNRRVLSPIRKIRGKLNGLSFLDKRVGPVITAIDETLDQMPGDAPVEGIALTALHGLILMLSDAERMKQYGQAILDGNPVSESLVKAQKPIEVAKVETAVEVAAVRTPILPMGNLFDDAIVIPAGTTQSVASEIVVAGTLSANEQPTAIASAEVETLVAVPEVANTEPDAPKASEPMVRVVGVIKERKQVTGDTLPPPVRQMPNRRITF